MFWGSKSRYCINKLDQEKIFPTKATQHLGKSYILKSSMKYACYMTNTASDVSRMSVIFTQFTYFPGDVSEMQTSLHSIELQLILHYASFLNFLSEW